MKSSKLLLGAFTLTLALTMQVPAQTGIPNGLVAYYPFNANANDQSGAGNNATVHGAQLAADRFDSPSSSYRLTADDQYITSSSSVGFPAGTNDFSISLWVSLSSPSSDHQIIFCNGAVNDLQLDVLPFSGTTAAIHFWTGGHYGSPDVQTSAVSWDPPQWYNIQVVRSANVVSIYRNGVVIGQRPTENGVNAPSGLRYLQFGRGVPPQQHQLFGRLDDVRVYSRALSSAETQQLFELESGPRITLLKAVKPSFSGLSLNTKYQLQVSSDVVTWTNQGFPFTATQTTMVYPQYWDVANWSELHFRLVLPPQQ